MTPHTEVYVLVGEDVLRMNNIAGWMKKIFVKEKFVTS
jgi:hypothetical protein